MLDLDLKYIVYIIDLIELKYTKRDVRSVSEVRLTFHNCFSNIVSI